MLLELVVTVAVAAYVALVAFAHGLLAVDLYRCIRARFGDGHRCRPDGDALRTGGPPARECSADATVWARGL